jgi:hypothetical protein
LTVLGAGRGLFPELIGPVGREMESGSGPGMEKMDLDQIDQLVRFSASISTPEYF